MLAEVASPPGGRRQITAPAQSLAELAGGWTEGEAAESLETIKRTDEMKAFYSERITRDPAVCGGNPIIKGTRIRIKVILDNLAEGHSAQDILESYPGLSTEDVQAVIAFAAASVADEYCHPVPEALTA